MSMFERALEFVLAREGGGQITDDPRDPGGLTRWGISQRAFPREDIRNLTRERAAFLYRLHYWQKCRCDELPPVLALATFDAAVNQGVDSAIRQLQRALLVVQDGIIGPKTIAAARNAADGGRAKVVMRDFLRRRLVRYAGLANADRFLGGWTDRVLLLHEECLRVLEPRA